MNYLHKPQMAFMDTIDNCRDLPFKPKIREKKFHSKKALELKLETDSITTIEYYENPYKYEIENIVYPKWIFKTRKEQLYHALKETPCYWVDTKIQFKEMLDRLRCSKAIAVDLEHHSDHSFLGLTCLMQISTRNEDFLIDCLLLRKFGIMSELNEIFANPNIMKVFHGAQNDILWLVCFHFVICVLCFVFYLFIYSFVCFVFVRKIATRFWFVRSVNV